MMTQSVAAARGLAALEPGETGEIDSFMFDSLRAYCREIGIREGERVRCRAGSGGVLILDTESGRTISLARDWARYIRIVPPRS
jgi:hypothetical protein